MVGAIRLVVPGRQIPDPPEEAVEIQGLLEDAGLDQDVIEKIDAIVMKLAEQAARECPECEWRAIKAEAELAKQSCQLTPSKPWAVDRACGSKFRTYARRKAARNGPLRAG